MSFRFAIILFIFLVPTVIDAQVRYLTLEPNHSTIGFEVSIANGATRVAGQFLEADMQIDYVDNDWTESSVLFTIDAKSIWTGIDGRDEHLRSEDFFDVAKFPEITFKSNDIVSMGSNQYVATGEFTMHGITKVIELPFSETYNSANTIGVSIRSTIDRVAFEVGHKFEHSDIPNFISEEIDVRIDFWTKRDKRR